MMRGAAVRYLGWQLVDRTGPRLLAGWLVAVGLCVLLHFASTGGPAPPPEVVSSMFRTVHFQLACLAVVILFHGIVAEDRVKGYFRFYLAQPVSPLWFYGQSAMLAVLAMVIFSAGYVAIFSLAVVPVWDWRVLTSGLALALLIGGVMFALSTVTQRDWIWMVVAIVGIATLRSRFPRAKSPFGAVLHAVLPPNHLLNELALTLRQWVWVATWAAALFALGMLVLRKRPLGED
jgi:hypothetical protein